MEGDIETDLEFRTAWNFAERGEMVNGYSSKQWHTRVVHPARVPLFAIVAMHHTAGLTTIANSAAPPRRPALGD